MGNKEQQEEKKQEQGGQGGTYTPPATQADLDKIINDRLTRERSKYADYDDLKSKAGEYDKAQEAAKSELQKAQDVATAEKERADKLQADKDRQTLIDQISEETKVPANLLRGSNEEEIKAHAESLKPLVESQTKKTPHTGPLNDLNKGGAPMGETTPGLGTLRAAYANESEE